MALRSHGRAIDFRKHLFPARPPRPLHFERVARHFFIDVALHCPSMNELAGLLAAGHQLVEATVDDMAGSSANARLSARPRHRRILPWGWTTRRCPSWPKMVRRDARDKPTLGHRRWPRTSKPPSNRPEPSSTQPPSCCSSVGLHAHNVRRRTLSGIAGALWEELGTTHRRHQIGHAMDRRERTDRKILVSWNQRA